MNHQELINRAHQVFPGSTVVSGRTYEDVRKAFFRSVAQLHQGKPAKVRLQLAIRALDDVLASGQAINAAVIMRVRQELLDILKRKRAEQHRPDQLELERNPS